MRRRELLYPIFLEAIAHAEDPYWETVFEDLAYGKCPYGTYISRGFLISSYKGKEFSYSFNDKDSNQIYNDVYNLLKTKLGIFSLREKEKKKVLFHSMEKDIKESRNDWSKIRRKNIKDIMFNQYAIDMKKKYNLDVKETKKLLTLITICMLFKTITSKDITYEDDKITSIEGIDFENKKVLLQRPLCSHIYEKDESFEIPNLMSANWEKFLEELDIKVI